MQKDPVCGMKVEEKNAAARSEHNGQQVYFYSAGCKEKFDRSPEQATHASRLWTVIVLAFSEIDHTCDFHSE